MNTLILNHDYKLVNDYDRVILLRLSAGKYKEYAPYFMHPFLAKFLSMFNGRGEEGQKLEEYGFTTDDIKKLTKIFTNNKKMCIGYAGEKYYFPKDVLVYNNNGTTRMGLENDYNCAQPYNFNRKRFALPKTIVYIINLKCYTNCIYCYANRKCSYHLMSTAKIIDIIQEAKKIGILDFTISGGEFFLQKDWDIILKALLDNNYEPEISTKIPLAEDDLLTIKNCGLKEIQFSLDTLNADLAKKTLAVKDNYVTKITESIKFADSIGLKVTLKPTFCKYTCTINNLKEVLNFAGTLKNLKRVTVSTAGKSIYLSEATWDDIRPSIKQVEEIEQYIEKANYPFEVIPDSNVVYKEEISNDNAFKNRSLCTANLDGFILLPDGKITLCEELYWNDDFILGDVNTQRILEIWNSEKALKLWDIANDDFPSYSACQTCDDVKSCRQGLGVCWKMVMQAYGKENIFYPDPRCPKAPIPTQNIIDQ
ncbi:MAG: radical SAM protein [Bacteroidales bacterium]